MSKQIDALKLALEALEYEARAYAVHNELQIPKTIREAITAIKEALAQPEQEPVAWMRDDGMKAMVADEKRAWIECGRGQLVDDYNKPLYKRPWKDDGVPYTVVECNCSGKTTLFSPPQPLKEPTDSMVLTLMGNSFLGKEDARDALQDILQETPLYTTPPQRKPLTDEQERKAFEDYAVRTICNPVELQRERLGGYTSQELNYLWRGWKARAAHGIKEQQ